jgi:hypothetical protein
VIGDVSQQSFLKGESNGQKERQEEGQEEREKEGQ